jgi:4-alpha-glucanotransferase
MPKSFDEIVPQLCAEFGIETVFYDIWGGRHEVGPATLLPILHSLGFDTATPARLEASAEAWRFRHWSRILDPAAVLGAGEAAPTLTVRLPADAVPQAELWIAIRREDGGTDRGHFPAHSLPVTAQASAGGSAFTALALPLPARLAPGYHDAEVIVRAPDSPDHSASLRLIVAPARAWLPPQLEGGGKLAGLAVSLYGLRSSRNWGAGDFTDLASLLEWVARSLGAAFVGLNPIHLLHNREPYNTSPYLPLSIFYRNPLYLDVESLDDFALTPAAGRLVRSPSFQEALAGLRASEYVRYEEVARRKRAVLLLLFRRFMREEMGLDTPRARQFREWVEREGALLGNLAVYCALDEALHARDRNLWTWPDWPAEYRDPSSKETAAFARTHARRVLFHKYVQWQIDLQLQAVQRHAQALGLPIGLYHDLALATDRCGADLWAYRGFFVPGCRVGSPPDDFAPEGQDWAFPPPNAAAHRDDGYRLFVETIRKNARHGGALRIDHVMRFFRLFWIPDGLPARQGAYVNDHWEDLIRILALESVRGRFLVVGEDLGTVPPALREAMERYGMLSYKLFYFEKVDGGMPRPPAGYARQALVSSTTHDLPTLAGFWAARDIDARLEAGVLSADLHVRQRQERITEKRLMLEALIREGFLPPDFPLHAAHWTELTGELHNAIIGWLVSTPSLLMLLNQEDLTKEADQQNVPGTTWQYPNWKRKMRYTIEDLHSSAAVADFARMFRAWLERSGRIVALNLLDSQPARQ